MRLAVLVCAAAAVSVAVALRSGDPAALLEPASDFDNRFVENEQLIADSELHLKEPLPAIYKFESTHSPVRQFASDKGMQRLGTLVSIAESRGDKETVLAAFAVLAQASGVEADNIMSGPAVMGAPPNNLWERSIAALRAFVGRSALADVTRSLVGPIANTHGALLRLPRYDRQEPLIFVRRALARLDLLKWKEVLQKKRLHEGVLRERHGQLVQPLPQLGAPVELPQLEVKGGDSKSASRNAEAKLEKAVAAFREEHASRVRYVLEQLPKIIDAISGRGAAKERLMPLSIRHALRAWLAGPGGAAKEALQDAQMVWVRSPSGKDALARAAFDLARQPNKAGNAAFLYADDAVLLRAAAQALLVPALYELIKSDGARVLAMKGGDAATRRGAIRAPGTGAGGAVGQGISQGMSMLSGPGGGKSIQTYANYVSQEQRQGTTSGYSSQGMASQASNAQLQIPGGAHDAQMLPDSAQEAHVADHSEGVYLLTYFLEAGICETMTEPLARAAAADARVTHRDAIELQRLLMQKAEYELKAATPAQLAKRYEKRPELLAHLQALRDPEAAISSNALPFTNVLLRQAGAVEPLVVALVRLGYSREAALDIASEPEVSFELAQCRKLLPAAGRRLRRATDDDAPEVFTTDAEVWKETASLGKLRHRLPGGGAPALGSVGSLPIYFKQLAFSILRYSGDAVEASGTRFCPPGSLRQWAEGHAVLPHGFSAPLFRANPSP